MGHFESNHSPALPATPDSPTNPDASRWHQPRRPVRPNTPNSADFKHDVPESRLQSSPSSHSVSPQRKALPPGKSQGNANTSGIRLQGSLGSSVNITAPHIGIMEPAQAIFMGGGDDRRRSVATPESGRVNVVSMPMRPAPSPPNASNGHHSRKSSRIDEEGEHDARGEVEDSPALQYHAFAAHNRRSEQRMTAYSAGSSSSGHRHSNSYSGTQNLPVPRTTISRPSSAYTSLEIRGRTLSPMSAGSDTGSPVSHGRELSAQRRSPMSRPRSYVESLANVPYNEQIAPGAALNNAGLQSVVGSAASLLDTKTTLGLYRANVKKTQDAAVQYEFAIFMINAARDVMPEDDVDPNELTNEAKQILHRLADRAYPFAQYYMGDGYFSGLFNKGKPDYDKAFPLFVAASKHGHAEAGYRAALCYEFGWGTAKSYPKALQFYKSSASKNHPGAATRLGLASIRGDMGLDSKVRKTYREGFKWLKRAAESADPQYNAGPFELGLLHLAGHGDDIFKDEAYAMQLITQAADLGHVQANFMLGQVYESGLHGCPKDAALSVHFYNGAATRGHVEGMMALCAWYMVGAEPVLERDEAEAYAWAKMAADLGYAKAEYAIGYFTEMGIGCRRDPLEANVRYCRAAELGNKTAQQRLEIIRAAASGDPGIPMGKVEAKSKDLASSKEGKKKFMRIF